MEHASKYVVNGIGLAIFLAFLCFFTSIFVYVLFSFILSMVLFPLTCRFEKAFSALSCCGRRLPAGTAKSLSALMSVVVVVVVFALACLFLLPAILNEIQLMADIDYDSLTLNFDKWLMAAQEFLVNYRFIEPDQTVIGVLVDSIKQMLDTSALTSLLGGAVNLVVQFGVAVFAILFLTFFFVRDRGLFKNGILAVVPDSRARQVGGVIDIISTALAHYFSGIVTEVSCMMLLLSGGMLLLGVRGALLFGVLGGLLNVIPYLGPVLGAVICCVLGLIHMLSEAQYAALWPGVLKIVAVFVAANIIDNMLLQPWIYSKQLKVHAVEIFLVILLSGMLAGIPGVLLAIPVYMILRTIVLSTIHPERFEINNDSRSED